MIPERQHGESWRNTVTRYASLDGHRKEVVRAGFAAYLEEGYSEERAAWLVLVKLGVL